MAHESTTAYLAIAHDQQTQTHPPLRDLLRTANKAIAAFQAGIAAQRSAFMDMQLDEIDPRITGLYVELLDLLKTCDRVPNELNDRLTQLPPLLDRHEAMLARLDAAAAIVITTTRTIAG
jgi:hypothetical protein